MPDLAANHNIITLAVAFTLAVVATARFTRLVTHDTWPPMVWARQTYRRMVRYGDWEDLVTCPFCFAPWPMLLDLLLGWGFDLPWWWWFANTWFAAAYLASMIVVRDEPAD